MSKITVEKISDERKKELGIPDTLKSENGWSVWECEPSQFAWHYDSVELAYLFEGKVKITTDEEVVEIQAGDFVAFPEGLDCTWEISETVRKVFQFK